MFYNQGKDRGNMREGGRLSLLVRWDKSKRLDDIRQKLEVSNLLRSVIVLQV